MIVLFFALTNNKLSNPFIKYRFLIGILYITVGSFTRKLYKITCGNIIYGIGQVTIKLNFNSHRVQISGI